MDRFLEQVDCRCHLHDLAAIHDGDAVAHLGDDRNVVGDEQDGIAAPFAQFANFPDDALLHQHIEPGGGFVHDDERRIEHQSHGDHRPLAHATGEFVRIGRDEARLEAHQVEHLLHPRPGGGRRHIGVLVDGLEDLVAHPVDGVERGLGALRHQRNLVPHDPAAELPIAQAHEVVALPRQPVGGDAGAPGQEAQQGADKCGLAATGLARQAQHLVFANRQSHPFHGVHRAAAGGVADREFFQFQQHFFQRCLSRGLATSS